MKKISITGILMCMVGLFSGTPAKKSFAADAILINGAGATFPYPIYSKWFDEFHKLHPEFMFNYQSIGSGGGIKQITEKTVDFGASDGPMSDTQLKAAPGHLFHFPTVMGAVVPVYNLQGVSGQLKISQKALADIYLGKIMKWNDPEIAAANPDIKLPEQDIVVCHRSDGSGTSYIFTDYLSKVSPDWMSKVGKGTSVNWPVGLGGKGNEGVAGLVKQTPNSIGYVELIYALQNNISYALVENKAGKYISASMESVSAAANATMPEDFRVSITNTPAKDGYPISGFTWLLVYEHQTDPVKGKAIVDFLHWMLKDGQKLAPALNYAPLPANVNKMEEKAIAKVKMGKTS